FEEGPAYFALRGGVPLVPIAITGTSWVRFRGRVQVRVGEPIETGVRPTRQAIAHYRARIWHALRTMVDGDRDPKLPSRFGQGLPDLSNAGAAGGGAPVAAQHRPTPAAVPTPPLHTGRAE